MATKSQKVLIQKAYVAFFGRPVDPESQQNWDVTFQLGKKSTVEKALVNSLEGSAEYQSLTASMNNAAIVNFAYQNLFGRNATQQESDKWVGKLESGKMDEGDVIWKIAKGGSKDDKFVLSNKLIAANLFTLQLDTPAEKAGYEDADSLADARAWLATIEQVPPTSAAVADAIVAVIQSAPVAVADFAVATEGGAVVTGSVATNDLDLNSDSLSFAAANGQNPVAGLTFNPNGSFSFNPANAAYNGLALGETQAVTFDYTVTDGRGGSVTSTLTITVTGTNDLPVAAAFAISGQEDNVIVGQVNATDVDGDTLTYTAADGAHGTVSMSPETGNFVYTPDPDYVGTDTFIYTVNDGQGGVVQNTVTVTVNDTPDILTPGLDIINLQNQGVAEVVEGFNNNLSAGDQITGGAEDSVVLSLDGDLDNEDFAAFQFNNVGTFQVTNDSDEEVSFDMSSSEGVQTLISENSTDDIFFRYANTNPDSDADGFDEVNLQALNLTEGVDLVLDVRAVDAQGEDDEVNLVLTDSDDSEVDADDISIVATGTEDWDPDTVSGVERVTLTTAGSPNGAEVRIHNFDTPGVTQLFIATGDDDAKVDLTIENELSDSVTFINATGSNYAEGLGTVAQDPSFTTLSTGDIEITTSSDAWSGVTVLTGSGNDTINTPGVDNFWWWNVGLNDFVHAGAGNDYVDVYDGNNTVYGGTGEDTIYAGEDNDLLVGGADDDEIYAGDGNNTVYGDTPGGEDFGNDTIVVGDGNDYVEGGAGQDYIDITAGGGDTVYGGTENDTVMAGSRLGSDLYLVNQNNWWEYPGRNGSTPRTDLDGGAGEDTLNATTDSGDSNDLDDITGFETINLTSGAWNITVTDRSSFDTDNTSENVNNVGAHYTYINASSAASLIFEGNSTSYYGNDYLDQTVSINGSNGADSIVTGLGNDTVYGNAGDDTIETTFGNDVVYGGNGEDSILSGDGADTVWGNSGGDYIDGGAGNDTIYGDDGSGWWWGYNDTIVAGAGNDTVYYAHGNDSIDLGADDDLLIVNDNQLDSNDALVAGGTGTDTIQLNNSTYWWTVADATLGAEVSGIQTLKINDNNSWWWANSGDVLITFEGLGDNYDNLEPGSGILNRSVLTIDGADLDAGETLTVNTSLLDTDGDMIDEDFNIIGGAGNDYFNFGMNLDSGDTVNGGAESDTVKTEGIVVDAAFTNVSSVEVLDLTNGGVADNVTLAAEAQGAGIRTVNGSTEADVVNASAYTVGLRVNANTGNDTVTTGSGDDTVDMGTGTDSVILGLGNDRVEVSGINELDILDEIDGGGGSDQIRLMNMSGEVEGYVDLDNVISVENYVIDGNGDRTGGTDADQNVLSFTGGTIGTVTNITIDATALTDTDDSFEVILEAGQQDPDYGFTILGSATKDILTKLNTNFDNNINFDGNLGNDELHIDGDDLGSKVTMDGGDGTDVIFANAAGFFNDDGFLDVSNVEGLSADAGIAIEAELGAAAAASGMEFITDSGDVANDDIVLDAAFTNNLDVTLSGGDDAFDAKQTAAVMTFFATAANITNLDDISGGSSAADIFNLTADNGTADLTNVDNVETFVVVEGVGGADDASITLTFANTSFLGVTDNSITIDGTALNDVDIFGASLPEGAMTVNAGTITTGAFSITAGVGHDSLVTGGGNDTIDVGQGNDTVNSGAGNDLITNSDGDNSVTAGLGDDTVTLGNGNNWIDAGDGIDSVTAGNGNNTVWSGLGADAITLGNGNNYVVADAGADVIILGSGNNTVYAGDDVDTVTIAAGAGDNYVDLGAGNDSLSLAGGLNGFNTVVGGLGADAITLGAANDSVRFDGANQSYGAAATRDTVFNFNVSSDDTIQISSTMLTGTATNIKFSGNVANFSEAQLAVGGLSAGDGFADIVFDQAEDRLLVDVNDDGILNALDLSVTMTNLSGDVLTFADFQLVAGVSATPLNDVLNGGLGNDNIDGLAGNDVINGLGGNDTLAGGDGNDTITGGAGNDQLNGGAGADTFNIAFGGEGVDTITGFNVAEDVIDFTGLSDATAASFQLEYTFNDNMPVGPYFLGGMSVFDTTTSTGGAVTHQPLSFSSADVATFLADINIGAAVEAMRFNSAAQVSYIAVASGGNTGIFRLAEGDALGDVGVIDADEITHVVTLLGVVNADTLTSANFTDF